MRGFQKVVCYCLNRKAKSAAVITHGGNIMNIMEEYVSPKKDYYQWHVENGCGYLVELERSLWKRNWEELHVVATVPHIPS